MVYYFSQSTQAIVSIHALFKVWINGTIVAALYVEALDTHYRMGATQNDTNNQGQENEHQTSGAATFRPSVGCSSVEDLL